MLETTTPCAPVRMFSQSAPAGRLIDNHGRTINYLRLSITDRCNLRCRYCRPEKGVALVPHAEILTFEEFERLAAIFCSLGITKIRVTGGEPFFRRGSVAFLRRLKGLPGLTGLHVTSNGIKTARYLEELAALGLAGLNLSLDTLDQRRFFRITRRPYLPAVLSTLQGALALGIPLKVNSVVLADTADSEIIELAGLARSNPLTLRFIELMPFSGAPRATRPESGNLLERLKRLFPESVECLASAPTTARTFSLPGYQGKLGIIEGYSRRFCRTCNKLRVTPAGILKTCLYDNGALDLKALLRGGATDHEITSAVLGRVKSRFVNGHAAEQAAHREAEVSELSMSGIGG